MWVRRLDSKAALQSQSFNSRTRVGATGGTARGFLLPIGFNSRTRVGATTYDPEEINQYLVSIHAPVWVRQSATDNRGTYDPFQFTHPCGCDFRPFPAWGPIQGFNSRTRVGATSCLPLRIGYARVSIHAPVWVRLFVLRKNSPINWFQFTHPCGCDILFITVLEPSRRFNSRTRVGATHRPLYAGRNSGVSIHAPVWVRLTQAAASLPPPGFQFTHPCGCDGLTNTV